MIETLLRRTVTLNAVSVACVKLPSQYGVAPVWCVNKVYVVVKLLKHILIVLSSETGVSFSI